MMKLDLLDDDAVDRVMVEVRYVTGRALDE